MEDFSRFKADYDELHAEYWSNSLTDECLHVWQEKQLRQVIAHAKNFSPFYAKHLESINSEKATLENLKDIPFTTKLDLRDSMLDILSGSVSDAIFYYETTGTTGPATPCPRDKKESYANNRQLAMAWDAVVKKHFGLAKPVVGIMGPTEVHSFGDTLGDVCYQIDCCNAKIWPHSPVIGFDKTLQLIKQLKIGVLASAPGMMLAIAKEAEKAGFDTRKDFDVKALMLSGELCTEALRKNLLNTWGGTAYNSLYGSQETCIIGSTDENNVMRPHRLNYIFELVDPDSRAVLPLVGTGELCVTMLIPGVKPLIRYRTGDLVTIKHEGSQMISRQLSMFVHGRTKDQLQINGRPVTPTAIESALLSSVDRCLGYQVQIHSVDGEDTISAYLEMSRFSEIDRSDIEKKTKDSLSSVLDAAVCVKVADSLDDYVNLGSWFSWKEARIVDLREGQKNKLRLGGMQA